MVLLEHDIRGLKCDNPKCDWEDMSISLEDYPQQVNALCPKCGECILTEADYVAVQKIIKAVKFTNKWFGWLGWFGKKDKTKLFSMGMDGSGKTTINSTKK